MSNMHVHLLLTFQKSAAAAQQVTDHVITKKMQHHWDF